MVRGTLLTSILLLCALLSSASTSNDEKFNDLYTQYEQYRNEQDFNNCIKCLENAMQYIHPDSSEMKSDTYNGLTWAYSWIGQNDKALDYGQKALEIDMKIGNPQNISSTLALIASIFTQQKLYDEAEHYMLSAIEYQPKSNTTLVAARYATLGEILTLEKKYNEAIEKIEYAYSLDTTEHRTNKAAIRLSQLGNVYMYTKDYKKANEILSQATTTLRETSNWTSLCINLVLQSKVQLELGLTDLAEQSAIECFNESKRIKQLNTEYESMKQLARIRNSPSLYEKAATLRDSLYKEQTQSQIAEFEVKYNLSEKDRQNAELQITIERQHHIMTLLSIIVVAFLIGGALTFSIYKMRRNIQHTELVARELFVGKTTENTETTTQSTSIIAQQDIHLSPREMDILKACCQGKLSKEIADELFISKRTVDAHKSTIYQKLGVSNNTELILYAAKHGLVSL